MKLQSINRYDAYKDSGVEWISATPSCWPNLRLKDVIAKLESGVSVNASDEPVEGDNIGVLKTCCVGKGTFLPDQNKSVWPTEIERVCVPVRAGRIIISRMNTPQLVGASAYIPKDYPNLFLPDRLWQTVFLTNVKLDSKWLSLLIGCSAFRFLLSTLATGTSPSMKNLGQEKLLSISFPFPPLSEQQAIAAYLDTKTAQIDRKIELLSQKAAQYGKLKQSLFNETVTRGLDKTVPMKDSGIEWIGDVPANWTLNRHKDNFNFVSDRCVNSTLAKVGLENIEGKTGRFISTDSEFDGDGVKFKKNDILFGKLRPYLAKVYLAEFNGNAVGDIFVYRPKRSITSNFAQYLMLSDRYIDVINSSTAGAKMPRVSSNFIANLPISTPPIAEQIAIVAYLDEKTAHIDRIVATINSQIDKLKELRKTLINDIVTGKICIFKQEASHE